MFLHRLSCLSNSRLDGPGLDVVHRTDFIRMQQLGISLLNTILSDIAGSAIDTNTLNEFLIFTQPDFFKAASYFSGRHCRILAFSNRL